MVSTVGREDGGYATIVSLTTMTTSTIEVPCADEEEEEEEETMSVF